MELQKQFEDRLIRAAVVTESPGRRDGGGPRGA